MRIKLLCLILRTTISEIRKSRGSVLNMEECLNSDDDEEHHRVLVKDVVKPFFGFRKSLIWYSYSDYVTEKNSVRPLSPSDCAVQPQSFPGMIG